MNKNIDNKYNKCNEKSQVSVEEIKTKIRTECEDIINFCTEESKKSFYIFEKNLMEKISKLGCLFLQLFLIVSHERLTYDQWLSTGLYYIKGKPISRVIKTVYGKVEYWRTYLVKKKGKGGFYPLDSFLGLTKDGFSPKVMSLVAWLATQVSFAATVQIFNTFYDWAPSTEAVEHLVLGIGREANTYMEEVCTYKREGKILIIEADGKATPTATKEELKKRRGRRKIKEGCSCGCQRHRGKSKRKKNKNKRRKKGDKSKNGRSTTTAVMYTLKRGEDGKLHGPINKKVWSSYAPRKMMLAWIRRQANKRGFSYDSNKRVHIAIDGEVCLRDGLKKLFPNASFSLDIRHLEEKIWKVGRNFYPEGSKELEEWVNTKRTFLYTGRAEKLIAEFEELRGTLSKRAKRDKNKYEELTALINYMSKRKDMMDYQNLIKEDLPIATGVVEGAVRYVVGERLDCSGMRWIPERAEALLQLRCIQINGDWEDFFDWSYNRWLQKLKQGKNIIIRTNESIDLSSYPESVEAHKGENCVISSEAA